VELRAAGERGVRGRERLIGGAAHRLIESAPPGHRPGGPAAEASVAAAWAIAHHRVVTGEAERLLTDAPTLSFIALAPAIGPHAAAHAIAGEPSSTRRGQRREIVHAGGWAPRQHRRALEHPSSTAGGKITAGSNHPVRC
jgi:hypothetical protein